ncbi:hypothetical protein, partial [Sphingomonas sp. Leaf21]|uniref:hypothetical protein n=1 Tax=Sphingomonas sp. Leaf21 TaxID=2876550 RepID=UPI001E51085C
TPRPPMTKGCLWQDKTAGLDHRNERIRASDPVDALFGMGCDYFTHFPDVDQGGDAPSASTR